MKRAMNPARLLVGLAFALASASRASIAAASCNEGCSSGYWSASSCWCDGQCTSIGDCCVDYAAQCMTPPAASCGSSRSWRPASLLQARPSISPSAMGRTFPDIGTAADGTALAIWQWWERMPMGFSGVRASRFSAGAWSAPSVLGSGTEMYVSSRDLAARVAVGASGHGFATLATGAMRRFLPATNSWSLIPSAGFPASRTSLARAVDSAGSLIYLYLGDSTLQVRRRGGAAWEAADFLGAPTPEPYLIANASGDFGAIFNPSYAYVIRRDEAEGGGIAARATPFSASSGRVGIADDGTVLGVWFGTGNSVQFSRLTSTITPAVPLASYPTGSLYNLRLAVNGAGQAIASWVHRASLNFEIITAVYDPSTGWFAPFTLVANARDTLSGGAPNQEVGIDACGAGHLVHEDAGYKSYAFRYTPSGGWGARYTFSGPALDVRLSTGANGVATVVWDNDQMEVLAARFE